MASTKQVHAAKRNVKTAQAAAKEQPVAGEQVEGHEDRPLETRRRGRTPGKSGGSAPKTWAKLRKEAKRRKMPGRSKMGRDELAKAIGNKERLRPRRERSYSRQLVRWIEAAAVAASVG